MKAYLDNGNTTPIDDKVFEEMKPYFKEKFGHPLFIYSKGKEANEAVEKATQRISQTLDMGNNQIIFTSGETEATDLAIRGIVKNENHTGHIITTKVENPTTLRICEKLENKGIEVDYIDVDKNGFIKIEDLRDKIREDTILTSIGHVNDEIGTIQPIEKITKIIEEENPSTKIHIDASASYGKVKIPLEEGKIDMITISSQKIHGPKAVGALVKKENIEIEPINYGYKSLSKIRPGTENVPGIVGFGKAAELAFENFEKNVEDMKKLRDKLIKGIEKKIPEVILHGPKGEKRSPDNVNFSFKNVDGESILMHLDMRGISVATGSACATRKLEPSHVLKAIDVDPVVAHGAIRFTLSRMNTAEEIDYTLDVLPEIIEKLREMSPMK